jgi:alpha-N-acetylglucosamine transferase
MNYEPSSYISNEDTKGYLYVAVGLKYVKEAEISARSLKRFTSYPICLYTDVKDYTNPLFDEIIVANEVVETYGNKIIGIIKSQFYKTIFLDGDTFICAQIDDLFDLLDVFDMSMMPEPAVHSYDFFTKYNPGFKIPFRGMVPEYQTSVMIIKKNESVLRLLNDWYEVHKSLNVKNDMPSFREAYLQHVGKVSINPLPVEYDYNGSMTFGLLNNEVKIIHEKIQEKWNNVRLVMAPYNKMEKHAQRLNKHKTVKRLVVPYVGTIPYYFSPYIIKKKIKKMLGIKRKSKSESF